MIRLAIVLSIGFAGLPLCAQNSGAPAGGGSNQSPAAQSDKTSGSKDKVTTDDSVYNPNGGPGDKATKDATGKNTGSNAKGNQSGTPPNPPIVDPHENPTSPTNAPKEGNLPKKGNVPEK